ncbi:MAG: DUF86 domain-containing protein [Syntrophomonadaceae bacterium]|nr:DUF86 domain-containing protein [Syntrophomonadaceae bacterium]
MVSDIIVNKVHVIERCLKRIGEEYQGSPANLKNLTKQDSIILNLQRACEAVISLAMHIVAERGLGVPQFSREAFDLLEQNGIIEKALAKKLKAMVGFRNIAIHDYQKIDLDILQGIIETNLDDLRDFARIMLKL